MNKCIASIIRCYVLLALIPFAGFIGGLLLFFLIPGPPDVDAPAAGIAAVFGTIISILIAYPLISIYLAVLAKRNWNELHLFMRILAIIPSLISLSVVCLAVSVVIMAYGSR